MDQLLNCDTLKWGLVLALPSIIVGATRYPKGGIAGFVLAVLDRVSILSHRDAKGTFKAPAVRSSKPTTEKAE